MEIHEILKKQRKASWWCKRADNWFSRFVRLRDMEDNGLVPCCTCGKYSDIKEIQAGHCYSRKIYPLRFNEINVTAQCPKCNSTFGEHGETQKHVAFLIDKHGREEFDKLGKIRDDKTQNGKFDRLFYLEIIQEYQKKVDELLQLKQMEPWWTKETKIEQLIREL